MELLNVIRCHDNVDWKKALPFAAFAVRVSYHSILNASPGQLIFGQDIITRKLYEANWSYMSKRRFDAILADNDRETTSAFRTFTSSVTRAWSEYQIRFTQRLVQWPMDY